MRESKKIERLGLPFSSLFPVVLGKPPELNPARLVWVQFQPELLQPLPKFHQKTVCFIPVLEPEYIIVGISDDNDIASRALLAPDVHPQVEHEYTEGSFVQKGQLLFEIDPRPFQAVVDQGAGQLAQANGQLAQAKAQLTQAEAQLAVTEANQVRTQLDVDRCASDGSS